MSTGYWQGNITNDAGDVIPNAQVEVREPSADFTGALVSLVDIDGAGLSNPFNADSEGFARFGTSPQLVDIRATGSGSQRTWRKEPINGTAAVSDKTDFPYVVPTIADLQNVPSELLVDGAAFYVSTTGRAGDFTFDSSDLSGFVSDTENYVTPDGGDGTEGAFVRTPRDISATGIEITVGIGGDYQTINDALAQASKIRKVYVPGETGAFRVQIRLLTGFVMSEQVFVEGIDLSYIAIVADDAEVTIERSALTTSVSGRYPAFGARDGGALPIIAALFNMDSSGDSASRDGVFVTNQCKAYVKADCGVKNAGARGFHVANNSLGQARGATFSGAADIGARISNNSNANLRLADLSGCGVGIATNGAIVMMADADVSGADNSGIFAQASWIYARGVIANNCQITGSSGYSGAIEAQDGSNVMAAAANLDDSGGTGVTCRESCVSISRTEPSESGSAKNATEQAIYVTSGRVVANGCDLSGAGGSAIAADEGSTVTALSANLDSCGLWAVQAEGLSEVNVNNASAVGADRGFSAAEGSTINAQSVTLSGTSSASATCTGGSRINLDFANFSTVLGNVSCFGSHISMKDVNATRTPAGSFDIGVFEGGIISAPGATGSTNETVNTVTAAGIIFSDTL